MKEQLHQKVERIVHRFGFANVCVSSGKAGQITLSGNVDDINDRACWSRSLARRLAFRKSIAR